MRSLVVPMAHVRSLGDSIAFEVRNTFVPEGRADPTWAWRQTGDARLMIALASEPVIADQQAVLFYLYCDDVPATRSRLQEAGVPVGSIEYPFHAPRENSGCTTPTGTF